MAKKTDDLAWIKEAFVSVQEKLKLELDIAAMSIGHAGTQGSVNESHWIDIFRAYLPDRYEVDTGFIIDSLGNRSQQIDLIIFDRHFTPTLLDQQQHRYIPAEAVYAVFECKPHLDKGYLTYAGEKAASVRKLHRTSVGFAQSLGMNKPKALFPIIAGIVAKKSSWSDGLGDAFMKNLPTESDELLDCGCALDQGSFDNFGEKGSLEIMDKEGSLIYFLFRLLSKLQSMGSVPATDWAAYASILSKAS